MRGVDNDCPRGKRRIVLRHTIGSAGSAAPASPAAARRSPLQRSSSLASEPTRDMGLGSRLIDGAQSLAVDLFRRSTEASLALLKIGERLQELTLAKVWPQRVGDVD